MALIDEAKGALRITTLNAAQIVEVNRLIDTAKADLSSSGIDSSDDTDPKVKNAIILFILAHFWLNNPESARYGQEYFKEKVDMASKSDYVV